MSAITTHVLDTSTGRPAAGVAIVLEQGVGASGWRTIGRSQTDGDGRARDLMSGGATLAPGPYRLTFDTRAYFESHNKRSLYPQVIIVFEAVPGELHYHVPLLLSPFGYSTYRGS
jgi:5-hydroxyisourate hydrolase